MHTAYILSFFLFSSPTFPKGGIFTKVFLTSVKPRIGITIYADGKPVTQQTGVSLANKEFRFKALLDTKVHESFHDFQPSLILKDTKIILVRDGRQISAPISNEQVDHMIVHLDEAKAADYIQFKFTLIAQRKNGQQVILPEQPIYSFPLHE